MSISQQMNSPRESLYFLTSTAVDCPYGRDSLAVYRYAYAHALSSGAMGFFLETGHRRNGNCIYTMTCPDCSACVPIRIHPERFQANRNQRRVLRKNDDITVKIAPLNPTAEKRFLCESYLKARYPDQHDSVTDYYSVFFANSFCHTVEFHYFVKDRLIGVGIVDADASWLNAVYFFFDPNEEKRSPGTFNILNLIRFCREKSIDTLFLGFWIKGVAAMAYKAGFKPHQLYQNGSWSPNIIRRAPHSSPDPHC